ncbi:hypothetical protein TCA2_1842 [Paenibacillus sp. TCA20]|nr:hypothetical protein TCA2_1842 [Paenibacillus sp. TCA20]
MGTKKRLALHLYEGEYSFKIHPFHYKIRDELVDLCFLFYYDKTQTGERAWKQSGT